MKSIAAIAIIAALSACQPTGGPQKSSPKGIDPVSYCGGSLAMSYIAKCPRPE